MVNMPLSALTEGYSACSRRNRNFPSAAFLIWQMRALPCSPCPLSLVPASPAPSKDRPIDLRQEIEAIECDRITMALELADGIVSDAARLLTLKRTTLIEKMRKYGVQVAA